MENLKTMENVSGVAKPLAKKRIEYIDAMRGFTMILVVFSHVCFFLFHVESVTNNIFILFRMPLFFFISGLMSYTLYTPEMVRKRSRNRLLGQLLPTLTVGFLFVLVYSTPSLSVFLDPFKAGYWFTFVMVEIFFFYVLIACFFYRYGISEKLQTLFLFILILVISQSAPTLTESGFFERPVSTGFSLSLFFKHAPYFFFGVLAKMHLHKFMALIRNEYVYCLTIVAFVGLLFYDFFGRSAWIQGFLGIIIVYRTFEYYKDYFSCRTVVGKCLNYIGKNTLEIYLLHYFFIFCLMPFAALIPVDILQSSWVVELFAFLLIAVAVVCLCLGVVKLVRVSSILDSLLFGFRKK